MNIQTLERQETIQKITLLFLSVLGVGALSVLYPKTGAYIFASVVVLAAFIIVPWFGYLVSLALLPCNSLIFTYQIWPSLSVEFQAFFITTLLTIPGWLIHETMKNRNRQPGYQPNAVNTLSAFFMLWSVIAILWSLNLQWGLAILLELFAGMVILFITQSLVTTKKKVVRQLMFLMGVAVILCFLTYISKWYYGAVSIDLIDGLKLLTVFFNEDGRPAGFNGVNHAATIFDLFIFFGISLAILSKGITRILTVIVISMLLTCVVITGSKGAFGSLIIALFFLNAVLPNIKGKRFFFFLVICTGIVAAYILGTVVLTGKIGSSRVAAVGTTFSVSTRFEWWAQGFAQLFNSYGVGLGTGGLSAVIAPYFAHNLFLSVVFDLGIVGTVIFVLLMLCLGAAFYNTLKICRDPELEGVLYCMIAAFIMLFINGLVQGDYYNRILWLMIGFDITVMKIIYSGSRLKQL